MVRCEQPLGLYIPSLFMSLQLICGTSGGELAATAQSRQEQAVFALLVILGAITWGHVIGMLVATIATMDSEGVWFYNTLDALNA